jgi:DNA-binding response OmpR family regulator
MRSFRHHPTEPVIPARPGAAPARRYHGPDTSVEVGLAKRVLVVDDDRVIQQLLEVNLELEGYDVVARASDGNEALDKAAELKPDIIILDIMMPKMDGLEVCRRLKADPKLSKIPVILLSARAQDFDVRAGLEIGASAYLTKPFDPVELLDVVGRLLKGERILPADS